MSQRLSGLVAEFERRFARSPEAAASAPGRVNLIGEHTDYCEGLVLPCAIDRDTVALVAARDDRLVRGIAPDLDGAAQEDVFDLDALALRGGWTDYVQGVAFALREQRRGPGGFDVLVASTVPRESGLSSSAALGVSVATALDARFGLGLDAVARARVAHRGESHFVGVGCGILDPFASALGREGCALRIDCRSEQTTLVRLPAERMALLVADSGVRRKLAADAGPTPYQERVAACRRVLEEARAAGIGSAPLRALRDLAPEDLPALERVLDPLCYRRARHVISENARVERVCTALGRGDLADVGREMKACQQSLACDYEVSTPELDALCESADVLPGVHGSRLTGAGFGGCTLHLVEPARAEAIGEALGGAFERRFGRRPPIHRMAPAAGARVLELP